MIEVGGSSVLAVGPFDPGPEVVLIDAGVRDEALVALAESDSTVWVTGTDAADLRGAAARAEDGGIARGRLVLEPAPGGTDVLVREGFVVACAPDRFGLRPGGALEATVAVAVASGARLVRTEHVRVARRCMDVTTALLMERSGLMEPSGLVEGAAKETGR